MSACIRHSAVRCLRAPLMPAVIVGTLAVGIGTSAVALAVVDAAILRPLPYHRADQLVSIDTEVQEPHGGVTRSFPGLSDFQAWRQANEPVGALTMFHSQSSVVEGAINEKVETLRVTTEYLSVLGVVPLVGRDFRASDEAPGAPDVALISHRYWSARFDADESILGRYLTIDQRPAVVVGVMPRGFKNRWGVRHKCPRHASSKARDRGTACDWRKTGGRNVASTAKRIFLNTQAE